MSYKALLSCSFCLLWKNWQQQAQQGQQAPQNLVGTVVQIKNQQVFGIIVNQNQNHLNVAIPLGNDTTAFINDVVPVNYVKEQVLLEV